MEASRIAAGTAARLAPLVEPRVEARVEPPVAPVLVFAWGNQSRGDDALGPLLVQRLQAALGATTQVEFLEDYQLQIEHALDLVGRRQVLFVDASLRCAAPFAVTYPHAEQDASFTTHAMSPQALLKVFVDLQGEAPPPCTLLAIRGERFELGDPPGADAMANLSAALQWAQDWIAQALARGTCHLGAAQQPDK